MYPENETATPKEVAAHKHYVNDAADTSSDEIIPPGSFDREITFAFGKSERTSNIENRTVTIRELFDQLRDPTVGMKCGSYFLRGACDGKRTDENVKDVFAAILDGDTGIDPETGEELEGHAPDPVAVAELFDNLGLTYCLYTTHSHGKALPDGSIATKWRAVIILGPTVKDWQGTQRWVLHKMMEARLGIRLVSEMKRISQPWFLSRVDENRADKFEYYQHEGHALTETLEDPEIETLWALTEDTVKDKDNPVLKELRARGLVKQRLDKGCYDIICPWVHKHGEHDNTGTAYYPPSPTNNQKGGFKCHHDHCSDRRISDLLVFLELTEAQAGDWQKPVPLPDGVNSEHQPLTLDMLPLVLSNAAAEVARFVQVVPASPAAVGLSVLATAIGKKAMVEERSGLLHHPSLFFCLIAASGERKSPVFTLMTRTFTTLRSEMHADYEVTVQDAKNRNRHVDMRLKALDIKAKKDSMHPDEYAKTRTEIEKDRLDMPVMPSFFSTDISEQRLFQKMHERGGAYAVMSGEGRGIFDIILGKYSGDGHTGDAIYLAGITGDTITRDRVGGEDGPEERHIDTPCLNVCLMVQPDKYMEVARHEGLQDSGALARISPVWLESLVGTRFEAPGDTGLDESQLQPYENLVRKLVGQEPMRSESGDAVPHIAKLSAEAATARMAYHNQIEAEMTTDARYGDVRAIASKATTQITKLALVLHIAKHPEHLGVESSAISLGTWKSAEQLGSVFLKESIQSYRLADEGTPVEYARMLLTWLRTHPVDGVLIPAYVGRYGPRPRLKSGDCVPVLDLLVDHGYLRSIRAAGHRKNVYQIHPEIVNSQIAGN